MNFLLLRDWKNTDPRGWLMSEKLDGWRAAVHGGKLWTRGGKVLNAPAWFMDGMPDGLDGELFAGRGMFNRIQGLMRDGWYGLTFEVFDAPAVPGGFADRLAALQTLCLPSHCQVAPQAICEGEAHLREFTAAIIRGGGEGAVMRDPSAVWKAGRSADVLRWVPLPVAFNRKAA